MPAFRFALAVALLVVGRTTRAEAPLAPPLPTRTAVTVPTGTDEALVVRFSPDGKVLAVAARDALTLRDPATLKALPVRLDAAPRDAGELAFAPDGKRLAAGGAEVRKVGGEYTRFARAWVWDAATGKLLAEFEGGKGDFDAVAFSADGKLLAAGETDGTVRVWDVATKKERVKARGAELPVRGVALSKDSALVIHAGKDGAIRLTDVATGREVGTLAGHGGGVTHLLLLPDGNTLITTGADRDVRVWDVAARKQLRSFSFADAGTATSLSVTADGSRVAVGLFRTVNILDLKTGKDLVELVGHRGQLRAACVAPNGRSLVSGDNFDTRVWVVPVRTDGVRVIDTGAQIERFALTPDGRAFATAMSAQGRPAVRVWDVKTGTARQKIDGVNATSLALSPDGKQLVAGVRVAGAPGRPFDEFRLEVWDADTGAAVRSTGDLVYSVHRLTFAPGGAVLTTADEGGAVRLRDAKTGGLMDHLTGQAGWSSGMAFSADGKRLATAAIVRVKEQFVGSSLVVWDAADGLRVTTVVDKEHALSQPAFAADGKTVFVCGSAAGGKRVLFAYDAATGAQKARAEGAGGAFAASADGKWLAFGVNTDIHLWDQKTLRPFAALHGHSGEVESLAFTADGAKLFSSGSSDGTVREWDMKVAPRSNEPAP